MTMGFLSTGLLTVGLAPASWAADSIPAKFPAGSRPTVENLRCEYLENPLGIDVLKPRLSWITESNQRGWMQGAYQILVASCEKKLKQDEGDLWGSGKAQSDRSIHVVYDGKPLTSRMRCYWKVRVWDEHGNASAWSKPAMWTMGLLKPEDWQRAQWTGLEELQEAKKQDEYFLFELPEGKSHTIDWVVLHNFGGVWWSTEFGASIGWPQ